MEDVHVELRRSGFADWVYDFAVEHPLTWPLLIVAFLALADLDRQRALAAAISPPEPVEPTRLPTRGGSLRRPW